MEVKGSNDSLNRSSISICVPQQSDKQLYINKCNIQSNSSDIHKSFSVSFSEEQKQTSTPTDESNDSNSSDKNKKSDNNRSVKLQSVPSGESKSNIMASRPSRKLPEIPPRKFKQLIDRLERLSLILTFFV